MLVRVFHYGKAKKSGWNSFIFKNRIFEHELKHVCLCVHVRKFEFPAKTGPPSQPNQKILEPEPGLVLTLSNWYKTSSNLDVHLSEPGHLHFVQVHFTTDKIRPGSAKIFFSGT
jgi:hypothetical protein